MKNNQNNLYTKKQLLSWINGLLKDLANGAAFCQLLDVISPGNARISKINWNAKLQHQNLNNLKLLSTSMLSIGIEKKFDAPRISQRKTQDILQLLQWFRKYFLTKPIKPLSYDPVSRRKTLSAQKKVQQEKAQVMKFKIKSPESLQLSENSYVPSKSEPQDIIKDEQLKTCYNINRRIRRIVLQEKVGAQKKLQLISALFLSPNPQTTHQPNKQLEYNWSPNSQINKNQLHNSAQVKKYDNKLIKIQDSHENNNFSQPKKDNQKGNVIKGLDSRGKENLK